MRFREKRITKSIINLTPMVDMLFLILLFFLVTSSFIEQPNIKQGLPSTKYASTSKLEERVLMISQDGKLFFQNKPVERKDLVSVLKNAFFQTRRQDPHYAGRQECVVWCHYRSHGRRQRGGPKTNCCPTIFEPENVLDQNRQPLKNLKIRLNDFTGINCTRFFFQTRHAEKRK